MKKHWTDKDFVVTSTSPAYDGKGNVNRVGYCRVCKADMQSFAHNGKQGKVLHYNSHEEARRLGLNWKR